VLLLLLLQWPCWADQVGCALLQLLVLILRDSGSSAMKAGM
jgi:hypothetical protein